MSYAVGGLVKARGREWVVLPGTDDEIVRVRPLGGADIEETVILTALEKVDPAQFSLPDKTKVSDNASCRLLFDAMRCNLRSGAGPFRSFGKIAVEPRPYQLVPLLLALKQETIRILIADDVGIGKTVEACLIAREMLDRGEISRIAVLCPPHLADQWQSELANKFNIDAVQVLANTAAKLEKQCLIGESIFEKYPFVIVSMDFIKSERRRDEFIRSCPEFIIIDEAHSCASSVNERSISHQRFNLVSKLAEDKNRHIVLVTATPHSGDENSFRSLISLLDETFINLPDDLTSKQNEKFRKKLANHFVQRRRADIRHYMSEDTPFPERDEIEKTYTLHKDYRVLFDKTMHYARHSISTFSGNDYAVRLQWWSILALLRSLASSPAAAAETLRNRAAAANAENIAELNEIAHRTVLDIDTEQISDGLDEVPGSDASDKLPNSQKNRKQLIELAKLADSLHGEKDYKLLEAIKIIKNLLSEGFNPIIFCRYIPTAEYLAREFRTRLGREIEIASVTGLLPPLEREERIRALVKNKKYILIATDCLSEGINLQENFNAVVHYDLSWNPTRHEQREGRVDRFGQPKENVKVVTYYGINNMIDGIVLDVLIKKHKTIRNNLGISVKVPVDSNTVLEAVMEGLILRGNKYKTDEQISIFDLNPELSPQMKNMEEQWKRVSEIEKRSRTIFAQETIKFEEVSKEITESRKLLGSYFDNRRFIREAFNRFGATVSGDDVLNINTKHAMEILKDRLQIGEKKELRITFNLPVKEGVRYITRTDNIIESMSDLVFNTAMDAEGVSPASRCGVIRTKNITKRTTLLLLRLRFSIESLKNKNRQQILAEECYIAAFEGAPKNAAWLNQKNSEALMESLPSDNVTFSQAQDFIEKVIDGYGYLVPGLNKIACERAEALGEAHKRVRAASRMTGSVKVKPQLPVDIVGVYVYLPSMGGVGNAK
jgi:superfamily II DNA or RNA helicase